MISPGKVQRSFHLPFPVAQNHLLRADGHPSSTSESLRETGGRVTFRFLVLLFFSFVFHIIVAQWELTKSLYMQMAVIALGNANKELSSLKPSGGKFHKEKPFFFFA